MLEPNAGELLPRRNGCRLREFDPSSYDWDEWEILLDTYLTVEGITDGDKKRNTLITALGVQPFKTLIAICKPNKPAEYTYDEIISKLRTNYARVTFASTERIKFFSLKQSSSQSLTDFANHLRDSSTTCKFPGDFYEEALITAFVGGLSNATVRKHLMQQDLETFEKTLNAAKTINSVLIQGANVERGGSDDILINKVQKRYAKTTKGDQKFSCSSCGSTDHPRHTCKFKDVVCHKCHKSGHIAKVCRSKSNGNPYKINTIASLSSSTVQLEQAMMIFLRVEQLDVQFELDTGSPVTIISSYIWKQLGQPQLQDVRAIYHSFSGHPIKFKGETVVKVNHWDKNVQLKVLVGCDNQNNILGRDWINSLELINTKLGDIVHNHRVSTVKSPVPELKELIDQSKEIFKPELGCCTVKAHLYLKPDATPKFCKTRSLPFAYREAVETDLTRLVDDGVLEPVPFAKWAAPIVVVPKPTGKVRICADFSTSVNKALNIDQYSLPEPNHVFMALNGGTLFTKIDLQDAYLPVEADYSIKEILFRFNRLPFGVSSAPSIFQNIMVQMLAVSEGTVCYLDDIIVMGISQKDHLINFNKFFKKIKVKWKPGILMDRQGFRLWSVSVENQTWRRHENQIKHRQWSHNDENDDDAIMTTFSLMDTSETDRDASISTQTTTTTSTSTSSSDVESPIPRRSTRIRNPVRRYIQEI